MTPLSMHQRIKVLIDEIQRSPDLTPREACILRQLRDILADDFDQRMRS